MGRSLPAEAFAHEAARNSSLVATRSWERVRIFSGSTRTTWVPAGSRSSSGCISSTSAGASDSMPSTAMPSEIFSSMSATPG